MGTDGTTRAALAALALALGAGCRATAGRQLEEVAKDWNRLVRASQVIPVYPLTQDLQPGDVFLVETPIERQQELWERADYLPLDAHLARLQPAGYGGFYGSSFFAEGEPPALPRTWIDDPTAAPSAAFPSYSFSVRRGGSLSLAVPVSGVPVGLSLLGADAAEGTLTLGGARTYGVDIVSLLDQVRRWGSERRALLAAYEPESGAPPRSYLRVVTRVYFVGSVDLSLRSADELGGALDAGAPKPVELLTLAPNADTPAASAKQYADGVEALNRMIAATREMPEGVASHLPGGSLRVTAASARAIAMVEGFDPPLVVGYLGFDLPILRGGFLGSPVPTRARLSGAVAGDGAPPIAGGVVGEAYSDALSLAAYEVLRSRAQDERARELVRGLDELADVIASAQASAPLALYRYDDQRTLRARPLELVATRERFDYLSARRALGELRISASGLEEALAQGTVTIQREGAEDLQAPAGSSAASELTRELERTRELLERLRAAERPRVAAAVAYIDLLLDQPTEPEAAR